MKLVNKCLTFIKENKIIVLSLIVVLLSFVLLALPGQFAHYVPGPTTEKKVTSYEYYFSGYEWMFATKQDMLGNDLGKPVAQGIAIFVMLILCVPGLLFSKKSSFVALLTSLALITISILFFSISAAKESYTTISEGWGAYNKKEPGPKFTLMSWVPYVTGSLIFIVGALMSYRTYKVMKEEIKRPSQPKGPTYSYLHK